MEGIATPKRERKEYGKFSRWFCSFVDGEFYLPALFTAIFIFWFLEFETGALVFTITLMILTVKYKNDLVPCIALTALMFFTTRFVYAITLATLLVVGFWYMQKNSIKITKNKMMLSIFLIALAYCLGGFDYSSGKVSYFDYLMPFGMLLFIFLYWVMFAGCKDKNLLDYFLKIMLYAGLLVSAELFAYYLRAQDFEVMKEIFKTKHIFMCRIDDYSNIQQLSASFMKGWGSSNNVGAILLMTSPACLYFMTKGRRGYLYFFPFLVLCAAMVLTSSRGALVVFAGMVLIMIFFMLYASENAKGNYLFLLALGLIAMVGIVIFRDKVSALFGKIFEKGFGTSGRDWIYAEALNWFIRFPILGAGHSELAFATAHNTVLSVMANMGIVGLAAFGYHYFLKYKPFFTNTSVPVVFGIFCMLASDGYGLLERNVFLPPFAFFAMMIMIATIYAPKQSMYKQVHFKPSNLGFCRLNNL